MIPDAEPDGEPLVRGAFLGLCLQAVGDDAPDRLRPHAAGTSAEVNAILETNGPPSEAPARALAHLAIAVCPSGDDRVGHVREAIALWPRTLPGRVPVAVEPPGSLDDATAVESWLVDACSQDRTARLAPIVDAVLHLRGTRAAGGRSAAVVLPVAEQTATGVYLVLEATVVPGAAPGIFEAVEGALAPRGDDWRAMEDAVGEHVRTRNDRRHAGVAVRYTLRERGVTGEDGRQAYYATEELSGRSGGLALAMATMSALRPVHRRSIDPSVAASGAVDPTGAVSAVERLVEKLTPRPEVDPASGDPGARRRPLTAEERRANHNAGLRCLVVAADQDLGGMGGEITPVKVATVDRAVRAARRKVTKPIGVTLLLVLLLATTITAVARGGDDGPDPLTQALRELPAAVDDAVRGLGGSEPEDDPDLGDLLRLGEAKVQPTRRSIRNLLEVQARAARRTTTLRPGARAISVRFIDDGQRVLVGRRDGRVETFDATTGRSTGVAEVFEPYELVLGMELSAGGGRAIYQSHYGRISIARLDDGTMVPTGRLSIRSASFTRDANTVIVGGVGRVGLIRGPDFNRVSWTAVGSSGNVDAIVHPDERRPLICVERGEDGPDDLARLDVAGGTTTLIRRRDGARVGCPVAALGDDGFVAAVPGGRGVEVATVRGDRWEVRRTTRLPWRVTYAEPVPGTDGATLFGDERVASVSYAGGVRGVRELPKGYDTAALSSDGGELAYVTNRRQVAVESVPSTPPGTSVTTALREAFSVAWAARRDRLVLGGTGAVALVDLANPDEDRLIDLPFGGPVRAVAVDADGRTAWAAGLAGKVARISLEDPDAEPTESSAFQGPFTSLALAPDGRTLAAGGTANTGLMLLDPQTLDEGERTEDVDVSALAWTGPSRLVVASGVQNGDQSSAAIRVVDGELRPVGRIATVGGGGYLKLTPRPGTPLVAAAGTELAVFDVSSGTPARRASRTPPFDAGGITWTPDGRQLLTSAVDGLSVSDATGDLERLGGIPGGDVTFSASRGDRLAVLTTDSGDVRILRVGLDAWNRDVCARYRRSLTPADWLAKVGDLPPFRTVCPPPRP